MRASFSHSTQGSLKMNSTKNKSRTNLFLRLFTSVKLTIIILIVLAIVSILGTIIPQQEGAVKFAQGLDPNTFRILKTLNLFDMYNSAWFRIIIGTLALNLLVCSLDRLPATLKRYRKLPKPDRTRPFENILPGQTFQLNQIPQEPGIKIGKFLKKHFKNVSETKEAGNHFFFGQKGNFSYFGVYIVHFSVLMILLGSLIGSIFGFEAFVNITEGEQISAVTLKKQMVPMALGFEVRCDKFTIDYYENGAPKEYRSRISLLVDGKELDQRDLLVNHPIQFRGITFYQSSYGSHPGETIRLKILRAGDETWQTEKIIRQNSPSELPDNEGLFQVSNVKPDFFGMGPAALIEVKPSHDNKISFWIFKHPEMAKIRLPEAMYNSPKFNASGYKPYTFLLEELENRYYTGLQVNRDPGVPIVWLGCFLMIVGFFITFFTSHRRFWIRITKKKNKYIISVAGTASKNEVGLSRELLGVTNNLKKLFKNEV